MEYLGRGSSYEELRIDWARYQRYLEKIEHDLPPNVRAFAKASWHYDLAHHWCLHDSWVEELVIKEEPRDDTKSIRDLAIHLRLQGAYHDGDISLAYSGVREYELSLAADQVPVPHRGHGDWLIDEIRLSARKLVVHEILFRFGGRWMIECADIQHATSIPNVRDTR
jgi:hypothetical protein